MEEQMTLLIADGNVRECRGIEEAFSKIHEVKVLPSVHDGNDVCRTVKETKVDILLMDTVLPGLDGIGVLNEIARMEPEMRPTTFINTLLYSDEILQLLQKLGVRYCFVKPTQYSRIVKCIFDLMEISEYFDYSLEVEQHIGEGAPREAIENEVTFQIRAIGMPAHLKGYHYLREAILMVARADLPTKLNVTTNIYPTISEMFHTRPPLVERAIRHAIEVAWDRGKPEVLDRYFGYTINDSKGKPTNAEFIAMLADRVRTRLGA